MLMLNKFYCNSILRSQKLLFFPNSDLKILSLQKENQIESEHLWLYSKTLCHYCQVVSISCSVYFRLKTVLLEHFL